MKRFGWLLTLTVTIIFITFTNAASVVRIAILPPGTTSPFHSEIAKGAQEKGEALGFRVEVQAPEKETDFLGQVRLMRLFIAKKACAISVNAIDEKEISKAIKEAADAKIPVFVHNSLTPIPGAKVTEYIGYNQRNGGQACGEYAAKLLKGRGFVFILSGIPGFHQIERTGGFLDAIKKYPKITIIGEKSADWERDKAIDLAMQVLKAHPEIDLFFSNSDEMAIGAAVAARNMGKKVFTIGIDGNPVTLDKIAEGYVTATLGVYPDKIGEQIISQMEKYFNNQKIPLFLETPAVVVDKSNLEDYKAGKLWTEPKIGEAEELPVVSAVD